jgi:hypothetical protein
MSQPRVDLTECRQILWMITSGDDGLMAATGCAHRASKNTALQVAKCDVAQVQIASELKPLIAVILV